MHNKTELFAACDKTLTGNWQKLGFAAALMVTAITLVFGIVGMPVIYLVAQSGAGIFSIVIAAALCGMYSFFFILFYGFFVLVIRIYKNDYVTAGFLFYGLRDWKRLFRAGFLYIGALFIASVIVAIPLLIVQSRVPTLYERIPFTTLVTVLSLVVGTITILLVFPYIFSVYYLYETQLTHTNNSIRQFLKKSRAELKGKKRLLLLLCIAYARRQIVYAAIALVLTHVISWGRPDSVFASILGFVYYILFYVIFIKSATLCTVFYYSLQSLKIQFHQPQ